MSANTRTIIIQVTPTYSFAFHYTAGSLQTIEDLLAAAHDRMICASCPAISLNIPPSWINVYGVADDGEHKHYSGVTIKFLLDGIHTIQLSYPTVSTEFAAILQLIDKLDAKVDSLIQRLFPEDD